MADNLMEDFKQEGERIEDIRSAVGKWAYQGYYSIELIAICTDDIVVKVEVLLLLKADVLSCL